MSHEINSLSTIEPDARGSISNLAYYDKPTATLQDQIRPCSKGCNAQSSKEPSLLHEPHHVFQEPRRHRQNMWGRNGIADVHLKREKY